MPAKITILSGSRQGEILEFDQTEVAIGDTPPRQRNHDSQEHAASLQTGKDIYDR
jgi:hypothetical protein